MNAPLPSAESIAAARWFAGKDATIESVTELDRLELGGDAALRVLEVATDDAGCERYLWIDGEVGERLVALAADGATRGAFSFEPAPGIEALEGERSIGFDQTNTSIVVGERLVAKVYRRIEPGVHPEIELGPPLTAAGIVPPFRGSGSWDGHPLLLVQDYVPDAQDGWSRAIAALKAGDPSFAHGVGEVVRRLEDALIDLSGAPATEEQLDAWAVAADAQLTRAIDLSSGSARRVLVDHSQTIRTELSRLRTPDMPPVVTRVHGDLHIGQVLRTADDRLLIVDFEGEPGKPLAERALAGAPLRDVAAMVRSFDHLARWTVLDNWSDHEADAERWILAARDAFFGGYGPVDRALLHAFEVEKECYEYTYAATYLPEWMPVAEGGMRWLLEHRV